MKCQNCQSAMFVSDETVNDRSHVTFYRCSVCASEQVSSEPALQAAGTEDSGYFDSATSAAERPRYFMA
ncbi:MAG: hypothetical protein QNJ85_01895 [Gammaproteobacteria bacterium]|nr:hypothetical protein [Gammaproteobacteria bacterium]